MSNRRIAFLWSLVLIAWGSLAWAQKPACTTGTISTSSGPVCGMTSTAGITGAGTFTADAYLGIPYAIPPVGSLRWQHSALFQGSAPLIATAYGNQCPQSTVTAGTATVTSSRCTSGKVLGAGQSEDCLYLNVWVPRGATAGARLPVMVFIHGGAFYQGSGGASGTVGGTIDGNMYDGTYLAASGNAIVVTFNYRLGALGFLSHGGKDNFGFTDQTVALEWVKTNIANFGGDPRKVTLFGESAGAKSVGLHTFSSPQSKGLFQAAIMESNALGLPYKNTSHAEALSRAFCSSGSSLCTAATSACDIVAAQESFMAAQPVSFLTIANLFWAPTVDGIYVTGQPMASAAGLDVPLITGTNRDEGAPFVYSAIQTAPKAENNNPPNAVAYAKILEQLFGAAGAQRIQSQEKYRCTTTCDCTNQLISVMTDFAFTCANRRLAIEATRRADPQPLYLYHFNQVSNFNVWAYTPDPVPQCNGLVCHTDELPYVFNSVWQFSCHVAFTPPEQKLAQAVGGHWTSFARRHNPGNAWPPFKPGSSYLLLSETSAVANDPVNASANCSALWDSIGYETPEMMNRLFQSLPATGRAENDRKENDFIIHGGDVVTMDGAGTVAEAVWVRNGRIEAVGSREEVMRHQTKATELIDLQGGALLPGFVEPHLHLDVTANMSVVTDLNPCLPKRYETRERCPVTIAQALNILKERPKPAGAAWLAGNGIDPSLMTLDGTRPSSLFHANPARYIAEGASKTKPVIILDKSGHLAYANLQAFVAAGICESVDNCTKASAKKPLPRSPGQWPVDDNGVFTGLLVERQAYKDFAEAMAIQDGLRVLLPLAEEAIENAEASIRDFARAGVTTMVNGGTGKNGYVDAFRLLALQAGARPVLRFRTLVPWQAAAAHKPSPWDEKNDGLFGISGIKVWADGSTQGCTAALVEPYDEHGQCRSARTGMQDYSGKELIEHLKPLWKKGWPIQIHVNGDRAILNALEAFAALQAETRNDSPIVLIHFTVGGNPAKDEDMVRKVADLRAGRWSGKNVPPIDLSVSHLIGHVAYWGGALENILDGVSGPGQPDENGRAARLDAARHELDLGVPFSMHSDSPVSPVRPLWYVEQAVTRNTWFYPKLTDADAHTMPGGQAVTIEEALRAVTLEPARQNGIDRYVGSIEKGKIADLVILDKNPLRQPPNEIHRIRVLSTFVGGHRNDWAKE